MKKIEYLVKINNEIVNTSNKLQDSRKFIKTLPQVTNEEIKEVQIVKRVMLEKILNTYKPKILTVFTSDDLDLT